MEYERNIESMGNGLVMFDISLKIKSNRYNYHIFYENGRKPPFDIAINPITNIIEYVNFFLQDEKIITDKIINNIVFIENNIKIISSDFSETNCEICRNKDIDIVIEGDIIAAIDKNETGSLFGYKLNESNYVLLNSEMEISGILLKDITSTELSGLKESAALQ